MITVNWTTFNDHPLLIKVELTYLGLTRIYYFRMLITSFVTIFCRDPYQTDSLNRQHMDCWENNILSPQGGTEEHIAETDIGCEAGDWRSQRVCVGSHPNTRKEHLRASSMAQGLAAWLWVHFHLRPRWSSGKRFHRKLPLTLFQPRTKQKQAAVTLQTTVPIMIFVTLGEKKEGIVPCVKSSIWPRMMKF